MEESESSLETLLIGLDGACHRVLEPLFEDGELPHLADLFDRGASGTLDSQVPPWTASAWPSLYTGTNPGKHGVFGFLDFDGYDWDVVDASTVRRRTLWEYLDLHGRTSVVVNAPVTSPPPDVDGAVVPGYLAPENPTCQPPGLLAEIRDAIGEYRVYTTLESSLDVPIHERVAEYATLARMRGDAFEYLADRFDPDFGFLQFQHTDTVLHEAPEDPDAVGTVYGAVDEQVGRVLEETDPDTVVVVSDHGLGPYEKRVRINEVLRDAGFVAATRGGEGMPSWSSIRDSQLVSGAEGGRADRSVTERALAVGAALGLTTQRIGSLLERVHLRTPIERRVPDSLIMAGSEQVDFPNSAAYVRSRVECGVRINLEGREPDGVVPSDEYDAVQERLISHLAALETPDGEPVFEQVGPRDRFFHGPAADQAVDVVAVPRDFDFYLTTWLLDGTFAEPEPPGWDHKREGVIAAAGDAISSTASLDGAHLFDVAPTVLSTLGLPWDEEMDGRPLPLVETHGQRSYPTYEVDRTAATADANLEDRLADLGYLE